MKTLNTFQKGALLFLGALGLGFKLEAADLSRFTSLYSQGQNLEDPTLRYQKLEALRAEAQDSLGRLMKRGSNIELELRYAELQLQRGRDMEQFSMELAIAGKEKESVAFHKSSQSFFLEGLHRHTVLLAKAKKHPMAPKIYLGMGRTELGLGHKAAGLEDADKGLAALRSLGSKGSEKNYLEMQLWILRGDAAFEMSRASLALESYSQALKFAPDSSLEEAYTNYRLAWTHYNMKDPEAALEKLDKLITLSRDKLALKQEAVQDYALFSADLSPEELKKRGGVSGLSDKLSEVSDAKAVSKALERMGKTLAKNGHRGLATECFEYVIEKDKKDSANVDRALTIVDWAHSLADKDKLTERYLWLLRNFGPASNWYTAQKLSPDVQKSAYEKVEASLRKYSVGLHQDALKVQDENVRNKMENVVAKLYDEHLSVFGDSARIHYYRAEIHRRRKEWAPSGEHYDAYLRNLDTTPKSDWEKVDLKLRDEAAWSAVQVWAKAAEENPKNAMAFLTASDKFLKEYPKHPQASRVALDAAKVELKASSRAVALKRLRDVEAAFPRTVAASEAVQATLDILNKDADYVNLALEARAALKGIDTWVLPAEKTKVAADLNKILGQTEAKACESLGQQKDREVEAALCFQSFAKGFTKDPLAPKALLLSAEIFDRRKDNTAALESLETLVKEYPHSEYARQGMSRLASTYERAFQFEKAVEIYESLLAAGETAVPDKDKIAERYLDLVQSLGFDAKLKIALASKNVPDSVKRSFENRHLAFLFEDLLKEEDLAGYDEKGLKSAQAQKLYGEIEEIRRHQAFGNLANELEYRRIKGALYRSHKQLDKADEEWMSGLKIFWKSKDKNSESWQAAAKLRLEEGSVWEIVYRNTDLQKNPSRKVELFKKLEDWYVEVLTMKSPVVALDALWASAALYEDLSRQMVKAPETQAKSKDFHEKSVEIVRQIARRAKEWKVLSPVVISALDVLRGQGSVERRVAGGSPMPEFPWANLPRWMDLSPEQVAWNEWSQSGKDLHRNFDKALAKIRNRSEARRAAFVSLARENSLKNKNLEGWAQSFNDRAGIQLRIQAMLQDGALSRARLFAEQYRSFFGDDNFSDFIQGRLEWSRNEYSEAYAHWMNGAAKADFRIAYLRQGWNALFEELSDGALSSSTRREIYSNLASLAQNEWQKVILLSLCTQKIADGQKDWTLGKIFDELKKPIESFQAWSVNDGQSAWTFKRQAMANLILRRLEAAQNEEELGDLSDELAEYRKLTDWTDNDLAIYKTEYKSLKTKVEIRKGELVTLAKKRAVAGIKP